MTDESSIPVVRVSLTSGDGKVLGTPFVIHVPRQLSKRIAKMHIEEHAARELKRYAAADALSALGFK